MNTELQHNARIVFIAIAKAELDKCPVKGPALAGSISSLKRRDLVHQDGGNYILGVAGKSLWAAMQEAETPKPVKQAAAKASNTKVSEPAKPKKAKAEKSEAAPAHNERTLAHVTAVRTAIPGLKQTDEQIAEVVWRVKTAEKAVEKAKEAFGK